MLQTLNIPSSPLPEVPSAQPGVPGDAGERAEFAQLLHQAKASDCDGVPAAPTVVPAKDARVEPRSRPGTARAAHDHKPHELRHARADADAADTADTETIDLAACTKRAPLTDALVPAADLAKAPPHTPKPDDNAIAPADAALCALMQTTEAMPVATVPSAGSAASDEHATTARLHPRQGARDTRLPTRAEAAITEQTDGNGARPALAGNDITLPSGKDAAFDLALRQAAGGRSTAAPLFDRTSPESTPAAAQAAAFARELQQPLAARADARAEASLGAPDEAGFAPAFGAQVALWVKDGVQEARLQLHPAELGPVTVQIALDGQSAHIDFTAAVAATRESIEQSLPALAAALRESGFTLAGGGVFSRSGQGAHDSGRERAPEDRGARGRGAANGIAGTGEADALRPRRWARSLVDLYA